MQTGERKRFPANTTMERKTFLNDRNIDSEIYALLQFLSEFVVFDSGIKKEFLTYVPKKNLLPWTKMCEMTGIKSTKTFKKRLDYLIESGYVTIPDDPSDLTTAYILPQVNIDDNIYFLISTRTIDYLLHNCKRHVFKIYIYLGQRFKWAESQHKSYEFTLEELGRHIGLNIENYSKGYEIVNDALNLLWAHGLIDYVSFYDGQAKKKKLTSFSYEYKEKIE